MITDYQRKKLKDEISRLAPSEGVHETPVGGVLVSRCSQCVERTPMVYEPGIVILASGRKRGYIGGQVCEYTPDTYLVLSSTLPWEVEIMDADESDPCLGMFIPVDSALIRSVSLSLDSLKNEMRPASRDGFPSSIIATQMDDRIRDAAIRLLEMLKDPVDAEILGPQIIKEIVYQILKGPQADMLRSLCGRDSMSARIHRILSDLNKNPERAISVPDLAAEAGMSVSAFHAAFKETTSMAPIQYQKAIRLHRAQILIVSEGLRVSEAAFEVGYTSPSQFSRDFRKLFGFPPSVTLEQVPEFYRQ